MTRILVALLVAALLAGGPAAVASAAPGKKTEQSAKKKKADTKKKAKKKKKKRKKKPAVPKKPAPKKPTTPPRRPAPARPPAPPSPAAGDYTVSAKGTWRRLYDTSTPAPASSFNHVESNLDWVGDGLATVVPGSTPGDFRLTQARVTGVVKGYTFESRRGANVWDGTQLVMCTRSFTETMIGQLRPVGLGVVGSTPADIRITVPDLHFQSATNSAGSTGNGCIPPAYIGGGTTNTDLLGSRITYFPVATSDGSNECRVSGTLATGWTRSCTASVRDADGGTETWTLELTIRPS